MFLNYFDFWIVLDFCLFICLADKNTQKLYLKSDQLTEMDVYREKYD